MRLSTKHANQRTVAYRDFSGGLNTTDATESIAQNELARAVNVCLDKSTGLLRTVQGTKEICGDEDLEFDVLMIDPWDGTILVTDKSQNVYKLVDNSLEKVGELTGTQSASYATWEDGLVIASGGKLQYYHGTMETLTGSPDNSMGVFVRDGRVWTWNGDTIYLSGVGDETNWTHDNNDASSAQYVQIGYKDRGNIKGVMALSSDVVIFKDNGHAYHLLGQYPDWQVKSIGRQLGIKNYECCLSVNNGVIVLGDGRVQAVDVTQDYGDMKASYISRKVENEIRALNGKVRIRYVPTMSEVWFLSDENKTPPAEFLTYDVNTGAYFHRRYNSHTMDVAALGEDTYILKSHCLSKVDNDNYLMLDEGEPMEWEFRTVTMVGYNDILLKRVYVDTTPLFDNYVEQKFKFGDVMVYGGLPPTAKYLYHNYGVMPHNYRYIRDSYLGIEITDTADGVYHNDEHTYKNGTYCRSVKCFRNDTRCVDHRRSIPVRVRGIGGVTLFNQIAMDVVEVAGGR